jgi:MoaA/NifB/PqqE/SkfB family radical SAM enzyme
MPFCYSPWTNIDISPQGNLSPCAKFVHPAPALNIKNSSIEEYSKSSVLCATKQSFESGKWPVGCDRCKIEEENSIESKRMLDYTRWESDYENYQFRPNNYITASVAFGNTCNLTCITCNPYSSSRWHKEYQDIYNIDIAPNHFYKQDFVQEFVDATPNLVHIDVPGGEPFLSGTREQKEMLQRWIDTGQAANMSIHYTTNATVYPDQTWRVLWQHFKNVDIQLSIDGIGSRQEYIRYPATWQDILDNTVRYIAYAAENKNLQLSVSHTVSAYNIYYLDEFFTWCQQIGLPRPWLGRVHSPKYMRPTVWPHVARDFIVKHLLSSQHADIHTWAHMLGRIDDSKYFNEFTHRTQQHDQYRGLNFSDTFSEMSNWIK